MKKLAVGVALLLTSGGLSMPTTHATPTPSVPTRHVTDPELLAEIHQSRLHRASAVGTVPMVNAEVLTADSKAVAAQVRALGGDVTGEVPGALVQAMVPAAAADAIANLRTVTDVRSPRRAGHVPGDRAVFQRAGAPLRTQVATGFGGTKGSEVESTDAYEWQLGGNLGAGVKVGIVDYFNFTTAWTVGRQGAIPNASHQFCADHTNQQGSLCNRDGTIASSAEIHGDAVAEIVRDMAPSVDLYIASVGTVADLEAAVNYFAGQGVTIMTRSLGAAFDGPGDGTGPLDTVVDHAVTQGITWFNSAGNDGDGTYLRRVVPTSLTTGGFVDFNDGRPAAGPNPDAWLQVVSVPGECYFFDGVRWANDWSLSPATDYRVEVYEPSNPTPVPPPDLADHDNPLLADVALINFFDQPQSSAKPLEAVDGQVCTSANNRHSSTVSTATGPAAVTYIRVRLNTTVGATPDRLEIGISGAALLENLYADKPGSAAHPVSDSANPGLVAVGAVDPPPTAPSYAPNGIASYSSQGPTNDGRIKPDLSAPSGFASETYGGTFSGTSSASPTAAGAAALVLSAGLAAPGAPLATLMKSFTTDLGPAGADNMYGAGLLKLPLRPSRFVPIETVPRILDTRPASHVGPVGLVGPYPRNAVINVDVRTPLGGMPMTAVALNVTSVNSVAPGFLNVFPYLGSPFSTSTLNITYPGLPRPNFAIVPVNSGIISVALQAGGDVILDVEGYFTNDTAPPIAAGRFVPLPTPERWLDTRSGLLPASFGGVSRRVNAGESIDVPIRGATAIPSQTNVDALVVNVTTVNADQLGFARAFPSGNTSVLTFSTINFRAGTQATANTAIVKLGVANGQFSLFSNVTVDMVVDVVGYITAAGAPASSTGMFMPVVPTRVYDTRIAGGAFAGAESRTVGLDGGSTGVVAAIVRLGSISSNLTVTGNPGFGFLSAYPGPLQNPPSTSNLNFAPNETVANAAIVGVNPGATDSLTAYMHTSGHVIIDVNGYFLR